MSSAFQETSRPGQVSFWGSPPAELFTKEIAASYQGVLAHNMVSDSADPMLGFVSASIDNRPWTDTCWTRDAGVYLRELAQWGDLENACRVAECLIHLVRANSQGFYTFPMYFKRGEPGSGSELDGTAAICIALVLLYERLPALHPSRTSIERFLTSVTSPLAYILHRLEKYPLIPGSGEFGGGMGFEGEFYNVVQNQLVRLALLSAGRMSGEGGNFDQARKYEQAAAQVSEGMLRYLRGQDGGWLWAVDTVTLQPDPEVLENIYNKGCGGLNGVLSMGSDVLGFTPLDSTWRGNDPCLKTFWSLFNTPKRKALFEKYGAWTQNDDLWDGYLTSPSYGQGYATQAMFLMDNLDMAGKAVDFLAQMTYQPFPGNTLDRESPYHFYERCYLPELYEAWQGQENQRKEQPGWIANGFDGQSFDQGCGALNLVNVAEPLKIARLILGVDDSNPDETRLVPRLPRGWSGYSAQHWPILTSHGLVRASLRCEKSAGGIQIHLSVANGQAIPSLAVRLPGQTRFTWQKHRQVSEVVVEESSNGSESG